MCISRAHANNSDLSVVSGSREVLWWCMHEPPELCLRVVDHVGRWQQSYPTVRAAHLLVGDDCGSREECLADGVCFATWKCQGAMDVLRARGKHVRHGHSGAVLYVGVAAMTAAAAAAFCTVGVSQSVRRQEGC